MALPNPQHVVLFHHFRRFLERAAEAGVDAAPLKGAHLVTSVYPPGEDRGMMADVDFLVRERDWVRTFELLEELGFERNLDEDRAVSLDAFYEAGFRLPLGDGRSILFEPHRQFVQPARHPIDYDAVWDRSEPSTFDGAPCRRLAVEDTFLHGVIHLMTHRFLGAPRGLRDLELLAKSEPLDWCALCERAVRWQCATGLWLTLDLLAETGRLDAPTRAVDRIRPPLPLRRALRFLVPTQDGFRFPGTTLRAQEGLLWPLLLDSPKQLVRFGLGFARLRVGDWWTSG